MLQICVVIKSIFHGLQHAPKISTGLPGHGVFLRPVREERSEQNSTVVKVHPASFFKMCGVDSCIFYALPPIIVVFYNTFAKYPEHFNQPLTEVASGPQFTTGELGSLLSSHRYHYYAPGSLGAPAIFAPQGTLSCSRSQAFLSIRA